MIEHRRIERMVELMKAQLEALKSSSHVDPVELDRFITTGVDFFRIYADRTHHGKEEDILFDQLKQKDLSDEHQQIMNELMDQHVQARQSVSRLEKEMRAYRQNPGNGDRHRPAMIKELDFLVHLYPGHIDKEDNHFFRPVMDYFTEQEQEKMIEEFFTFDRGMIHEKYERAVGFYEQAGI